MPEKRVDVYVKNNMHPILNEDVDFLNVFHYSKHDLPGPFELGKIELLNGLTIHFHQKRPSVNAMVMLTLLEEIYAIGSTLPKSGIEKLSQVIKFLKEHINDA